MDVASPKMDRCVSVVPMCFLNSVVDCRLASPQRDLDRIASAIIESQREEKDEEEDDE